MGFVDIIHYTMKKDAKPPKMLDENNSMQHTFIIRINIISRCILIFFLIINSISSLNNVSITKYNAVFMLEIRLSCNRYSYTKDEKGEFFRFVMKVTQMYTFIQGNSYLFQHYGNDMSGIVFGGKNLGEKFSKKQIINTHLKT